jgi:biotin carboxylase
MLMDSSTAPRLLLLVPAHTYRQEAFLSAARKLGVEVALAADVPPAHATRSSATRLQLDFRDPARSAAQVREYAGRHPVQAILGVDDATVTLAAHLNAVLDLPRRNSVEAAQATRDKYQMRQRFAEADVPSPWFQRFDVDDAPEEIAAEVHYPCVIKPTCLSGSRGVIRANDPAEFIPAFHRLKALLAKVNEREVLVEGYLPGAEFALEGLLDNGRLIPLALFDKPDPLEGPFFEETIYTTPTRYPAAVQAALIECAQNAARAVGLREGPVHAELRWNERGPWMLEIAGRSIGGLCSQTLRFAQTAEVTLEELIVRQALGMEVESLPRESRAGGVMMIPIPNSGILSGVDGLEAARVVPGIESIEITAPLNYPVTPLPEGESYLGFIFARGDTPAEVEAALRAAHRCLSFDITPALPIES